MPSDCDARDYYEDFWLHEVEEPEAERDYDYILDREDEQ